MNLRDFHVAQEDASGGPVATQGCRRGQKETQDWRKGVCCLGALPGRLHRKPKSHRSRGLSGSVAAI